MTEMLSTNHKNVYVFKIIFHKTFLYIQIIHKNVIDKLCSKRSPPPTHIFLYCEISPAGGIEQERRVNRKPTLTSSSPYCQQDGLQM